MENKIITRFDKLHLACGEEHLEGFLNVDKAKTESVDFVCDLESFPWPFDDNSIEEIVCNHYVEHTPLETYGKRLVKLIQESIDWTDFANKVDAIDLDKPSDGLIMFMEEVYRILKPGGSIRLATPYYLSDHAFRDPTHRRYITEATYNYFNKQWRIASNLMHYGIKANFEVEPEGYRHYSDKQRFKTQKDRIFAIRHLNNTVMEMFVRLRKV